MGTIIITGNKGNGGGLPPGFYQFNKLCQKVKQT